MFGELLGCPGFCLMALLFRLFKCLNVKHASKPLSSPGNFQEGSDVHPGIQKLNVTGLQEWRSGELLMSIRSDFRSDGWMLNL